MATKTTTFQPAEAMVRIGTAMGIPQALCSLGFDPDELLAEGGFDPHIFDDPDNLISFTTRSRLIAYCAAKTQCEHFGLLIGRQMGIYSLGLVGLLMRYSPDVGTALNNLVRYFHLHAHGVSTYLEVRGSSAILGFDIHHSGSMASNQTADAAIAIMLNCMRELCRPGWKPTEIWFMHSEPQNLEHFRSFFRVRLRFNAEQHAIVFHASTLTVKLPEVHSDLRRMVQKQIDLLESRHGGDFPEQVRSVVRAALHSEDVSADRVAALFSIHPRTLNRHLSNYGIRYRELVDEIRFELARQMLSDSHLEVGEIALILLYADARSFIRAFKRWSGETPARWRRRIAFDQARQQVTSQGPPTLLRL